MEQVIRLSHLAKRAGLDGVVCSPQEVEVLRTHCGDDFKLVTPGIRPAGSDFGDQRRVMTPKQAIQTGADFLVIGRPITQAQEPLSILKAINASIA
ncbi:orotidine 5'-phosphate decarboxylase / HUMPS family protein [[Haemophilus] ducreyi]